MCEQSHLRHSHFQKSRIKLVDKECYKSKYQSGSQSYLGKSAWRRQIQAVTFSVIHKYCCQYITMNWLCIIFPAPSPPFLSLSFTHTHTHTHTLIWPNSASYFCSSEGLMHPDMEASFTATIVRSSYCSCASLRLLIEHCCWAQVRADISRSANGNQCARPKPT